MDAKSIKMLTIDYATVLFGHKPVKIILSLLFTMNGSFDFWFHP